jgi:hypothetical protein
MRTVCAVQLFCCDVLHDLAWYLSLRSFQVTGIIS